MRVDFSERDWMKVFMPGNDDRELLTVPFN